MLDITLIPVLKDNYAYLIQSDGVCGIVDPGESKPVINACNALGLRPKFIFNTHHHWDHIAGNNDIKRTFSSLLVAPMQEKERIPDIDILVESKSQFLFGNEKIEIIKTPGHTRGHVCFFFPESKVLFCGDTLFSGGCGRIFEGSPEQMFSSLIIISSLPEETKIFCGHEYTLKNLEFCQSIEPDNQDILNRLNTVIALRAEELPTLPTTLEIEKKTNVFLRQKNADDFARIRNLKDNF